MTADIITTSEGVTGCGVTSDGRTGITGASDRDEDDEGPGGGLTTPLFLNNPPRHLVRSANRDRRLHVVNASRRRERLNDGSSEEEM